MIILVTGTRLALAPAHLELIGTTLAWVTRGREGPHILLEGGARGADGLARSVAEGMGWEVRSFPAKWGELGRRAGPVRNQEMVDVGIDIGVDVCLAFPAKPVDPERSGTMDCARRAVTAGIPTLIFPVDV